MSHLPNTRLPQPASRLAESLVATCLLLFAIGCASGPNGPLTTWRVNDPPQLSPFARSLSEPIPNRGPYGVGRPVQEQPTPETNKLEPLTTIKPRQPASSPVEPQRDDGPQLGPLSAPSPAGESPVAPYAEPEFSVQQGEPLQLTVSGPANSKRGDDIPFQITVRNNGAAAVEGVTVTCRLPDGLVFPDAPQRAFRQRLGRLKAEQQETLDLTLRCVDFGRHCVEFSATAPEVDEVSKSACVKCESPTASSSNAASPTESLELTGPSERTIGGRAEFVLTLRNLTGIEQPDVHVVLQHEGVLEPREASAGAIRKPGRLEWDLGMLRVDERVQIQVEFECLSITDETCLTAVVTGRSLDLAPVEACLRTTPRETIDLNIVDGQDPVMMGERVTYIIHVTNAGLQTLSNASIQLQAQGLQPVGLTIGDNESPIGATFDRSTGLITVPIAESLAPDATQTISLQTLATRAGAGNLRAVITQRGTSLSISSAEPTVINPLGNSVAWDDQ